MTSEQESRIWRKIKDADYWMKRANYFISQGRKGGYSREAAERRLNEVYEAIDRILGRLKR